MPFGVKKQKSILAAYGTVNIFPHEKNDVQIALLYTVLQKKRTMNIDKKRKT